MNDPDIFAAFAIGNKRYPLPIRRKLRLAVERHAAGNQLGLPALDRQRVEISHQLEHNSLAIRRNIQRKPRAFIGREGDLAVGLQRQTLFLVLLVILLVVFFLIFLIFVLIRLLRDYSARGVRKFVLKCRWGRSGASHRSAHRHNQRRSHHRRPTTHPRVPGNHAGIPSMVPFDARKQNLSLGRMARNAGPTSSPCSQLRPKPAKSGIILCTSAPRIMSLIN